VTPPSEAASAAAPAVPAEVFIEAGKKRVFACALDWPGWARSAKTEQLALETLTDYLPRYAPVVHRAGLPPPGTGLRVVERAEGTAGYTDFGVPGIVAERDRRPLTATDGARLAALLEACWAELDQVAATAPELMRKGPRGGGRDRDQIVEHVIGAEAAFARKLGVRPPAKPSLAGQAAVAAMRSAIVAALRESPRELAGSWPARYAVRRIGWHVLDHAWEMADKSL
jgi:hypothetical protein